MRWPGAGAEELADKDPSREAQQQAATAGRWLWVLKGLIAFVPAAQRRQGGAVDDEYGVEELRGRSADGSRRPKWATGTDCFQELESTQLNGEGVPVADLSRLIPQAQEDEDAMKAAARKIGCGGFRAAKSLLECKLAAPPTPATNEEIANLAAMRIDEAEREQTKLQCVLAGKAAAKCRDPRVITVKAAKRLNMAAPAGPSQLINHDLTAVARVPGGPKLLAQWARIWLRGSVCQEIIRLWTGVRMVALDEGWAKPAPGEELERNRKLRPIACAEPLLKFAETLIIEGVWTRRTRRQGRWTSMWRWTRPKTGGAIHGTLGIDLGNASGRMFRSQALKKGARHRAPRTAAMAATQWCAVILRPS